MQCKIPSTRLAIEFNWMYISSLNCWIPPDSLCRLSVEESRRDNVVVGSGVNWVEYFGVGSGKGVRERRTGRCRGEMCREKNGNFVKDDSTTLTFNRNTANFFGGSAMHSLGRQDEFFAQIQNSVSLHYLLILQRCCFFLPFSLLCDVHGWLS